MYVKRLVVSVLLTLVLVQCSTPVLANTPTSIEIEPHVQTITSDQVIRFSGIVKDSSGNQINEEINWTSSSGSIDANGLFVPGEVGLTTITASVGTINSSTSVMVSPGWPVGIQSLFNQTEISIDDEIDLTATLIDRAGNQVQGDLIWRCQNGEIDHTNLTWKPDKVGTAVMRIIYFELETQVTFNVVSGNPDYLEIPYGITVQSGTTFHVIPVAKDSQGNEVELSKAGQLAWNAENGTISPTGLYYANSPGIWNITVNSTSGASGVGIIRVLPAQATGLNIEIDTQQARTGSPVNLSAIRSDILGNEAEVTLPLSNWSVPSGSLSMEDGTVVWVPAMIGNWTIGVSDQGFSATIQINVIQGEIIGIELLLSEEIIKSGDLIVASISAYDNAGNHRSVDGAWLIDDELNPVDQGDWYELRPGEIGNFSILVTWFDNETQNVHEFETFLNVEYGELARIILPESGTQVPSDGVLDLMPIFEDEYGNIVDQVMVMWVVDGVDTTMEIRLAGDKWAPSELGMHEIRATAQGVYAITDVEVVAGSARQISTNYEQGIEVNSGEGVEIIISTLDIHGNIALASEIQFEFEDPLGIISPSSTGDGHWIVTGGEVGEWNLRLSADSASKDITVLVNPGQPVRLIAEIPDENPEQGGKMIIRIHAIDQAGNRIEVPPDEVTIKCTTGDIKHLAADTYEVSIELSGQSQSCNAFWNDLIAQKFFDVDAVLFGGGLGDSNTALSLVSFIIFLFIAIMIVLIRRIRTYSDDEYNWEDELEDEDDEIQSGEVVVEESSTDRNSVETIDAKPEVSENTEDLRARLAEKAKQTGVMQAAPGTEQGKTGWYIDSDGQLTSWLVSESDEWTRVS